MRIGRALGALVVSLGIVAAGSATAQAAQAPTYYLSLGDSLSQGYQPLPAPGGDTDRGYTDVLYQRLKAQEPNLVLEKAGCSGETTTTMIEGPKNPGCSYPEGSQLAHAVAFLKAHPGAVTHVTVTIGANDVQRCAAGGSIDYACVGTGLVTIAKNMPTILGQLRAAGGNVQITGANYYNPFLSFWNQPGTSGKFLALASSALQLVLNQILASSYGGAGAGVADLAGEFASYSYLPFVNDPTYGNVPRNVSTVCTFTFICSAGDIHATNAGYVKIADAYSRAIGVPATAPIPAG